jgi:hypothetical protein
MEFAIEYSITKNHVFNRITMIEAPRMEMSR